MEDLTQLAQKREFTKFEIQVKEKLDQKITDKLAQNGHYEQVKQAQGVAQGE